MYELVLLRYNDPVVAGVGFSTAFLSQTDEWRLSDVNKDFGVCPSYPPLVAVPKGIDDEALRAAATFRHGGRFPVLSYYHKNNGMVSKPLERTDQLAGFSRRTIFMWVVGDDASVSASHRHQRAAVQGRREAHQRHPQAGQARLRHRHARH